MTMKDIATIMERRVIDVLLVIIVELIISPESGLSAGELRCVNFADRCLATCSFQ